MYTYVFNYVLVKTVKTNTVGVINMLGLAKRVGAKFLLASTSEVYGDPEVHPQPETYYGNVNPIGPRFAEPYSSPWPKKTFDTNLDYSFTKLIKLLSNRACYDEGKRIAETLVSGYAQMSNVSVRIARIFNTYGPR